MNKERFFRVIGQIDDRILARYHQMDERLARRRNARRAVMRMLTAAACFVLIFVLCMPLVHPVGQAALAGDFEPLAERLYEIEGYEPWREQTVEKLEQYILSLPKEEDLPVQEEYALTKIQEGLFWETVSVWNQNGVPNFDLVGYREYKMKYAPEIIDVPVVYFEKIPGVYWAKNTMKKMVALVRKIRGK